MMDAPGLTTDFRQLLATSPANVVILVGAGVSMGTLRGTKFASISSWAGLLRYGIDHCQHLGFLDGSQAQQQREHLESADPLRWIGVAESITNAMGGPRGGEFRSWLAATAGKFADESHQNDVLEALAALSERGVILATVNYDGILEKATGLPPVTWRQRDKVENVLRGTARGILHLHGYWDDPESVILGSRSYQLVTEDEHARTALAALRMIKTWVFLGHGAGLRDPNWSSFLRWTETVFAGSPHRHYRLVCEHELAQVRSEHPITQRIVALRYGENYDALGPFLASLVPSTLARRARSTVNTEESCTITEETCVILRVNIGEARSTEFISREEALSIVNHPNQVCVSYDFGRPFNRRTITPRQWRAIARGLDQLVDEAKRARKGPTHFVIVARAPLPVLAYLGARMFRFGKVSVANDYDGGWQLYGPHVAAHGAARDDFTLCPPKVAEQASGKLALALRTCERHSPHPESIKRMVAAEGCQLIGTYDIFNDKSKQGDFALTNAELATVLNHVDEALAWRSMETPRADGMIFALACPNWLAFFLTNRVNPNVVGRMDFPIFADSERGYLPALSWPMQDAPWVTHEPRIMVMCAEPMDATRTRAGELCDVIRSEFERVHHFQKRARIRALLTTRVDDVIRELENFRPDILHVHLHASDTAVGFENHQGDVGKLAVENFIERLRVSDFEPTVIVLTACHSATFAEPLCGIAECVIAMAGEARVASALEFSRAFYAALARGKSLDRAIRQGQVAAPRQSVVHLTDGDLALQDIILFPGPGCD